MSTCVTGNIDLHSRDTVRTCARASRRKVIVHGGKREYALHKTRPPSRLLAPLYSATRTHAVLVSPIPLPYVTPYSPPRLPTRLLLFLRLLILPTLQLSAGEKLYSPLEKWPLVECATELAAVRIGALASPREIVTSNQANLRARGERERETCYVRGLQRTRPGNNSTAPLAPQR